MGSSIQPAMRRGPIKPPLRILASSGSGMSNELSRMVFDPLKACKATQSQPPMERRSYYVGRRMWLLELLGYKAVTEDEKLDILALVKYYDRLIKLVEKKEGKNELGT